MIVYQTSQAVHGCVIDNLTHFSVSFLGLSMSPQFSELGEVNCVKFWKNI